MFLIVTHINIPSGLEEHSRLGISDTHLLRRQHHSHAATEERMVMNHYVLYSIYFVCMKTSCRTDGK